MYTYLEQFIDEDGSLQFFRQTFAEKTVAIDYLFERYNINKDKIFKTTNEEEISENFNQRLARISFKEDKFVIHAVNGVLSGLVFAVIDYTI